MKSKFLVFVMVMAMALTMIPGVALAAGGVDCSDSCTYTTHVAAVGNKHYTNIQDAIVDAAPSGTVELLRDVTVDKWIMFAESLSIGDGTIITLVIDGLTINGNNHTLTVNDIESANNGNRLFYDATKLNINDLTIKQPAGKGGIGLKSGTLDNVKFEGGVYGVLPQGGDVTIDGCTFATNGTAIYFEAERDGLTITGCTFNQPDDANAVLLRGDVQFTNNIINSGRTVNVVSGSPVVTGNDFNNVRLKVYNDAEATIANNEINNLEFSDDTTVPQTTFTDNTLSEAAEEALVGVGATNTVTAPPPSAKPTSTGSGISVKYAGGNSFSTSKSDVPTSVEIDGVPVTFNGNGSSFTVGCIDPNAKWVTVRWNSTSVTTNFTPDAGVVCSEVAIPKTGDMSVFAAVMAFFGF